MLDFSLSELSEAFTELSSKTKNFFAEGVMVDLLICSNFGLVDFKKLGVSDGLTCTLLGELILSLGDKSGDLLFCNKLKSSLFDFLGHLDKMNP